jgi:DNA transformation protein and related proteins
MNPTSREFVDYCLELLAPMGAVRARRMFGGHGLYVDDAFVALIAAERLYLKVDASTRARFEAEGCAPFVYDAKGQAISLGYFNAPQDAMDSPALMLPWARLALDAALRARSTKRVNAAPRPKRGARRSVASALAAKPRQRGG